MEIKKINKISVETLSKMKRKSMLRVPNNPSEQGLKPEAIKRLSTDPMFNDENSMYSEINRIVDEINGNDTDLNPGIIGTLNKKVDKTVIPNQVYLTDNSGFTDTLPYSVAPIENTPTIPLRDKDGRLKVETPIEPQHAVNKDYADFLALVNKLPIYEVSEYNPHTGEITLKINTNVVENIDTSRLEHEGIIRMYANIFNFECPKGVN